MAHFGNCSKVNLADIFSNTNRYLLRHWSSFLHVPLSPTIATVHRFLHRCRPYCCPHYHLDLSWPIALARHTGRCTGLSHSLVTLAHHTRPPHSPVTLTRRTRPSHSPIALARRTCPLHLLLTLARCTGHRTFQSHWPISLARRTCPLH